MTSTTSAFELCSVQRGQAATRVQRLALASLACLGLSCSSSEGGVKQSATTGSKVTPTSQSTGTGNRTGANASANPYATGANANQANAGLPTATAAGGTTGTPTTTGDPSATLTDAEACQFLTAQPWASHLTQELGYLCNQGGLSELRQAPNSQTREVLNNENGGISTFLFASAARTQASIQASLTMGNLFCTDFNQYKQFFGAASFEQVESITPMNKTADGCDYHFKGAKILMFQPAYQGQTRYVADATGRISANVGYLVQPESMVQAASTVAILIKDPAGSVAIQVQIVGAENMGMHDMAHSQSLDGFQKAFQSGIAALAKGGI